MKNINLKESSPKCTHHENKETFRKTETCCQCCATTFKWKWRDMWPSMVTHTRVWVTPFHTRNLCSALNTHTHRELTPWSAIYAAAPGEQLGVQCLAQGHLSHGIEGGRECCTFTPPTYNSCRTWDSNAQPLGYESDSLTIRPRLPPFMNNCFTTLYFSETRGVGTIFFIVFEWSHLGSLKDILFYLHKIIWIYFKI